MFDFLKYIDPGNYYRLVRLMPHAVLCFPSDIKDEVGYDSAKSHKMDLAYQLLQSGWIPDKWELRNSLQDEIIFSVKDNYIFINRFFSKFHVIRIFLIRIICLKNPFYEFKYFFGSWKHKIVKIQPIEYFDFNNFESSVISSKPLISVIIPTLNRYEFLRGVLSDLEKQDYTNFEVIICDQSDALNENFYVGWDLDISLLRQDEKALWLARNSAIQRAKGVYIALTEDDVELPVDWLSNHLKCIDFFDADVSAGRFYKNDGIVCKGSKMYPTFKYSHQFPTGNSLLKKTIFRRIGLFDRQFENQRMGDGEFGLRALTNGFKIVENPLAFIVDLKAPTGGLRQMGSWDAWRPTSFFAPRPIPSVLYFIIKYHGFNEVVWYIIKNLPLSYVPYRFKNSQRVKILVLLLFPFFVVLPILCLIKSWRLSKEKLKKGPLIEFFV